MKHVVSALAIAASFSFIMNAHAQQIAACVPVDKITNVYFSNGIMTNSREAEITKQLLQHAYKSQLENLRNAEIEYADETYVFLSAKNNTQGLLTDVIQVLQQKATELGIEDQGLTGYQIFSWINNKLSAEEIRLLISLSVSIVSKSSLSGKITNITLTQLSDTLVQANADAARDAQNVNARHINFYEADLVAGKRVIVVAHSQGNLFTNSAVSQVKSRQPSAKDSIAIVGVASPAAQTVDGSYYVTAHDDRVINALRLTDTVLPSNINNVPLSGDDFRSFLNHYFEQDYFDPRLSSRSSMNAEILRLASSVPYPTALADEGAIRATLTWGAQPDIDLHAYEPDGSHVYYASRQGTYGFLDVDDITSYGPENYFVACEDLVEGQFRIGVNYYQGSGPETATVSLFLGSGQPVSPRSVVLPMERGFAGDNSPQILFTIDITKDTDGNFVYMVQ